MDIPMKVCEDTIIIDARGRGSEGVVQGLNQAIKYIDDDNIKMYKELADNFKLILESGTITTEYVINAMNDLINAVARNDPLDKLEKYRKHAQEQLERRKTKLSFIYAFQQSLKD